MKKIYILSLLFLSIASFGQAPQLIPYQAIARDATGQALANTSINARFTIHDETATGAAVWQEIQTVTTTALGLFTAQLGSNVSLGSVDWASGSKFMQVEIDLGSGFVEIGNQQMLSVPYAMYAASAGNNTPGPQGPIGLTGPQGQTGAQGQAGANGTNGADGKTVLNGVVNPTASIGNDGDFYINTATNTIFGPKFSGTWPATGVFLVGPQGATGADGPQGPIGLTGATGPQGPIGLTGLTGATGPLGPVGLTGPQGPQGPQGPIGLTGPQGEQGVQGPAGDNGEAGLSAYEIWLSEGNEGSINDFLYPLQSHLPDSAQLGDMLFWDGNTWMKLGIGQRGDMLTVCDGVPHWGPCPVVPPAVSTKNISSVTPNSFDTGLLIVSDGGGLITASGICYSTNSNPTIGDQINPNTQLLADFNCSISGLAPNTTYYIRAYATNTSGTSYGQQLEVTTTNYEIGSVGPGGGIIFYDKGSYSDGLYAPQWRYIEILPFDITNYFWGCNNTSIGGYGTYYVIGAAYINTQSIHNYCNNSAATQCYNYSFNGFSDWLMPSVDELVLAYNVLNPLGLGNLTGTYWTSTQASGSNAFYMSGGMWAPQGKAVTYAIRPVRIF